MIPSAWLPNCKMARVVIHWTAGTYVIGATDKEHYHFILDGAGVLHRGDHSIDDNISTADGDYAAHTRGCNTGAIGYALAGMAGAVESPFNAGRWPIKRQQWDQMIVDLAKLCRVYSIPPTSKFLLTHAEVQRTLGIAQRGKWDIARLPFDTSVKGARAVGDRMRAEVVALLK